MSTHMPGFQSFFSFFASFCIGKISHQRVKLMLYHTGIVLKVPIPKDNPLDLDLKNQFFHNV